MRNLFEAADIIQIQITPIFAEYLVIPLFVYFDPFGVIFDQSLVHTIRYLSLNLRNVGFQVRKSFAVDEERAYLENKVLYSLHCGWVRIRTQDFPHESSHAQIC